QPFCVALLRVVKYVDPIEPGMLDCRQDNFRFFGKIAPGKAEGEAGHRILKSHDTYPLIVISGSYPFARSIAISKGEPRAEPDSGGTILIRIKIHHPMTPAKTPVSGHPPSHLNGQSFLMDDGFSIQ
ncbi:MAG: hypothetical protein QF541_14210, partial [Lentisphaeria bacterium]|nr:hypothetical protein [Lentisphaeria bacterium]